MFFSASFFATSIIYKCEDVIATQKFKTVQENKKILDNPSSQPYRDIIASFCFTFFNWILGSISILELLQTNLVFLLWIFCDIVWEPLLVHPLLCYYLFLIFLIFLNIFCVWEPSLVHPLPRYFLFLMGNVSFCDSQPR